MAKTDYKQLLDSGCPVFYLYSQQEYLVQRQAAKLLELLSRVSKTYHTTVVIITHNASIAPLGDRVIRMRNGTIVENTVNPHPARVEDIAW